ncbi:MAG: GGDEF domain-containing protein [Syntrophaceae bacterium]
MSRTIAEELKSDELYRFHSDFRRALLMHRRKRLNYFFRLQFPTAELPLVTDEDILEALDFRLWLSEEHSETIIKHSVYRNLTGKLQHFIKLSSKSLDDAAHGALMPEQFWDLLQVAYEFDRLADRLVSGITASLTDIDELTGLLNRKVMEQDLDREQAHSRSSGRPFTIAMIDADHFKEVNDNFGHGFGDIVLETLADLFLESLRPRDRVYRYGGEEFLVLLPDTSLNKAEPVLERLRLRASKHEISDGEFTVYQTVSIGAVELTGGEELDAAINRADVALYRAKQRGRNRVELDEE